MRTLEMVVAAVLEGDGYWTQTAYKVALSPEERREIDRRDMPEWELSVVAYKPAANELLIVDCGPLFAWPGTRRDDFFDSRVATKTAYELFNERRSLEVVGDALIRRLVELGLCRPRPTVRLCLAAPHFASARHRNDVHALFEARGWQLWDDAWFKESLAALASQTIPNDVVGMVAKLLLGAHAPEER